jgi:ribosomal protein S27AE
MGIIGIPNKRRKYLMLKLKKKCSNCGSSSFINYKMIKCDKCGYVGEDFFKKELKKEWKLKITYDDKKKEIWIKGNKNGLEFLASCCLSIIGKIDPSGHIHLQWQMNNLMEGSVETRLEYSDDPEDYI